MNIQQVVAVQVSGEPAIRFPLSSVGDYVVDANGRTTLEIRAPESSEDDQEAETREARRAAAVWVAETLNREAQHVGII